MPEGRFDFGEWDIENLRISIFCPVDRTKASQAALWEKVVGSPPESIDTRPREGVTRESGPLDGNLLVLAVQASRVDWLAQPIVDSDQDLSPTLKAGEDVLTVLQKALGLTLELAPIVSRLAFGVSLIRQVPDPQLALQQLSKYLPDLNLNSMEGSDFIHQVNRRRLSSTVPNAQINRLARWSVARVGAIHVRMGAPGQPQIRANDAGVARHLILDVNTTTSTSAVSPQRVPALLKELEELAGELARKGDVP